MNDVSTEPTTVAQARLPAVTESFGAAILRVCLDQMRTLPDLWQRIPEEQQQGCIDIAREAVDAVVRAHIRNVLAFGFPHVEVGVESLTGKESGIKVALSVHEPASIHDLADALGRKCVLVLMDPTDFAQGMDAFKADADQPGLPLGEPETTDDGE